MAYNEINLIKNRSVVATHFGEYERIAQKTAWWSLLSFLLFGLLIGGIYVYGRASVAQLEAKNQQLKDAISVQNIKEGILLSLKSRTLIAQKALDSVRPWGLLFPLLLEMAPASAFQSFSVDLGGKVTTSMQVGAIEEAIDITRSAIRLTDENRIRQPELSSLVIKDDGSVAFGITFIPIF